VCAQIRAVRAAMNSELYEAEVISLWQSGGLPCKRAWNSYRMRQRQRKSPPKAEQCGQVMAAVRTALDRQRAVDRRYPSDAPASSSTSSLNRAALTASSCARCVRVGRACCCLCSKTSSIRLQLTRLVLADYNVVAAVCMTLLVTHRPRGVVLQANLARQRKRVRNVNSAEGLRL
jgi:hypothetical protein